jgi:hypothetical protein
MPGSDHPYRDQGFRCPTCADAGLREFNGRLVCDTCSGIYLTHADLVRAIEDLSGIAAALEFFDQEIGARCCPRCSQPMTACRIRVGFPVIEKAPTTAPTLDRCEADGIWFDGEELEKVFQVVLRTAVPRGGGHAGLPARGAGWGFGAK